MEEMVVVTPEKLEKLMKQKLEAAGLHSEHAEEVDRPLPFFMAIMAWVNLFVTKH